MCLKGVLVLFFHMSKELKYLLNKHGRMSYFCLAGMLTSC